MACGASNLNTPRTLQKHSRYEETIQAYDEVLRRCGDATEPTLRQQVADPLSFKTLALGRLYRHEEAIQTSDGVLRRFGDETDLTFRQQVAHSLANEASRLPQFGAYGHRT
jgi:hypothetical protein